jgi:phage terminase large subunit
MEGQKRLAEIPYIERPEFTAYHNRTQRWSCIVAHRRAGKTVACINDLIQGALTCPLPNPRFAYIAPLFVQAKDVAWTYLKEFGLVVPGTTANEVELRLDFPNGGRVRLYGAENYNRLRGFYLDGAVLDEPADMDPRVFGEVLRPALSDRQGWATWIGTPKGHNHFYDIAKQSREDPSWFSLTLKASETGIVPAVELADAKRGMTADQYEQEFECSFEAAILGAYYGREMAEATAEGRLTNVPYDKYAPVSTWWDLGVSDSTAIWFVQRVGGEIHVVDYYEGSGVGLDHYVAVLKETQAKFKFQWGPHLLPHDIQAREISSGKSRLETLRSLGLDKIEVVPIHAVMDGINAARRMLPKCWFDVERCERGIEALRQYRVEYDDKNRVFRKNPLHNWASHGADAFRQGAAVYDERSGGRGVGQRRYRDDKRKTGSWMTA